MIWVAGEQGVAGAQGVAKAQGVAEAHGVAVAHGVTIEVQEGVDAIPLVAGERPRPVALNDAVTAGDHHVHAECLLGVHAVCLIWDTQ